jgi:hypothetical protein
MTFNLATILTETALAAPDAPVYRFTGAATTYGELDEQSGRIGAGRPAGWSRCGSPDEVDHCPLRSLSHDLGTVVIHL